MQITTTNDLKKVSKYGDNKYFNYLTIGPYEIFWLLTVLFILTIIVTSKYHIMMLLIANVNLFVIVASTVQ